MNVETKPVLNGIYDVHSEPTSRGMREVVDKSMKSSLQLSRPVVPSSNQFFIGPTCCRTFSDSPFQDQSTGQPGIFAHRSPGSVNYKQTRTIADCNMLSMSRSRMCDSMD